MKREKVCCINFGAMLLEHKTGVGICQENAILAMMKVQIEVDVMLPLEDSDSSANAKRKWNHWIANRICKPKELLSPEWKQYVPIELYYGYHKVYLMNTSMYRSILPCYKIAWVHDMMAKIYPNNYSAKDMAFHKVFFNNIKYADLIIATSKTTKRDIMKYCNITSEKIEVVYNGIDNAFYDNADQFTGKNDNIDFSKRYLLYIGDMRKNKNLLNAIKGFEKYLEESGDDCYFYIAGSKRYEYARLRQYTEGKGLENKVIFLGYVSDEEKMSLYRNAYALLFVSEYEGFGIPIIEAMASKIPVITSNVSSMKELATGYGILVDPYKPEEICQGILSLYNADFRYKLINQAYLYSMKFSKNRFEQKFIRIISKVMKKR